MPYVQKNLVNAQTAAVTKVCDFFHYYQTILEVNMKLGEKSLAKGEQRA